MKNAERTGEVWSVKKHVNRGNVWGIISNRSDWFIAEEMLKRHAELVVDLFNNQAKATGDE